MKKRVSTECGTEASKAHVQSCLPAAYVNADAKSDRMTAVDSMALTKKRTREASSHDVDDSSELNITAPTSSPTSEGAVTLDKVRINRIETTQYLKFYSKSKEGISLSNFAALPVQIGDRHYRTGEHAFHGEKYRRIATMCMSSSPLEHVNGDEMQKADEKIARQARAAALLNYSEKFCGEKPHFQTALDAKKGGGKKGMVLHELELKCWNDHLSYPTQIEISTDKYKRYEQVRQALQERQGKFILHQDNRANKRTVWGGRVDRSDGLIIGKNNLGHIWMNLRNAASAHLEK